MKKYVKNIGTFILFAVFLLNSVPKVFVHQNFSNHTHETVENNQCQQEDENVLTNDYHCECEKYFTDHLYQHSIAHYTFHNEIFGRPNTTIIADVIAIETPIHRLRGPPVFVM